MAAMGHIVVGVDATPQAAAALRRAAEEAAARGCHLTAVLAWGYLSQHHRDPGAPFDPHYNDARAREALDAIVERTLGPQQAESVDRRTVCDLPARALLDAARDADLLVVGSRDLHGIRRAIAGSVSARCRRRSPCPMIIVHHDGRTEQIPSTASRSARPQSRR